MSKQFLIRLVLILLPLVGFAQETKVQLTDKVSISFPEKPTTRDIQGMASIHTVRLADSTANFNAVVSNLEKSNGLSADVLESAQLDPGFWDQAQAGFVAQLGPDAKVLSKEVKQVAGKQVLNLVVSTERNGKKSELTVYIFVQGVYSINIVHTKRADNASVEAKNKFFNSLQIAE